MMVQFANSEALDAWKNNDAYVTQKVWETVDVKHFKQAVV
jgi:uncharacterized protein YciI